MSTVKNHNTSLNSLIAVAVVVVVVVVESISEVLLTYNTLDSNVHVDGLKIKEKMIKYFVQQATNLSIPTCKVSTTQKTLIRLYNINFVNKLLSSGHRFKWFYVNGQIKINRCLSSNLLKNNWTNIYQMKWKQNIYLMFH